MTKRVVITGMGIVSPLGCDVETVWKRLLNCECAVSKTEIFDSETFPTQFSAQVTDFDFLEYLPEDVHDAHKSASRNTRFMLGAAMQAWQQAKLPCPLGGAKGSSGSEVQCPSADRVGVYLGAGEGPVDFGPFIAATTEAWQPESNEIDWVKWAQIALEQMDPAKELEQEPNMPVAHIARLFGLLGPTMSCLTACAASTQAIGEATELIRNGQADIIITGGAHSMIHPLGVTGFNRLTALSTRNDDPQTSSRPFDKERDGFVLAEGAGALILEDLDSAKKRGVPILAEVIGYGTTADAFRVTDQHEDGRGGTAAVRMALADAGLAPSDIDYISAHGTGTSENDSIETRIIHNVFGDIAGDIPVSSVKSMLGHLIAAAGVVEMITCVLAVRDKIVPPTTNLTTPDPDCDLDYVPNAPRKVPVHIAMSNSFGFGGQNNTVIIREFSE
ncbi:MAG: beta-ketoacyl-[acyl-carrier-protein] synthase family protein [Phycisphaerae bacterium]|nr:beta-ketoacyl-[acyl-carrier-protein] synthase family protein [Phycisphaerae bacterium]